MGAATFSNVSKGKTAKAAFQAAVEEARYDYGHRGYTGSIAEKSEFVMVAALPLPEEEAEALADRMIDEDDPKISDKWGPAGCIEIASEGDLRTFLFFGWASS